MPNFTITREIVNGDSIGCTSFQTNQSEGDMATLNTPGTVLDGDIVWYIDANPGYIVDVSYFDIPNTQATPVAQSAGYKTREDDGSHLGLPFGVNGVVFEQINSTRIKFTIFLHPSTTHGITGPVFVMPGSNVNVSIPIEGCARLFTEPVHFRFSAPESDGVELTAKIAESYEGFLVENGSNGGETISGDLPEGDDKVEDREIVEYTVEVKDGYEFISSPILSVNTNDYAFSTTIVKDSYGKVTSSTFKITKTI